MLSIQCRAKLPGIQIIGMQERHLRIPELICLRYNPGPTRTGNSIIGNPVEAKYGVSDAQIVDAYKLARELGAKRFGLHTMLVSNELNYEYMVETVNMLLEVAERVYENLDIVFEFINIGGGIGITYKPEQTAVDIELVSQGIKTAYERLIVPATPPTDSTQFRASS